jgi:type II secretory pathway component PulK
MILIMTRWVVLTLTALTLMLASAMRVEAIASVNDGSAACAMAIEQGATQYVLNHLRDANGVVPLDTDMPCQAVRVGAGAFWIIRPNFDDDRTPAFGVVDESSKVNINTAGTAMLSKLPDMTDELAASIIDWRDADSTVTTGGAENEYYLLLPEPYQCKNAPFESVEELLLVRGASREILYGEDANRNGVLDANEDDADASEPLDNRDGRLDRGLLPFLTVYSEEPNTDGDGKPRVNINNAGSQSALSDLLKTKISASRAGSIMRDVPRQRPYRGVLDFYVRTRMTAEEFAAVADSITTSTAKTFKGLINVNTAPKEVLMGLPGLEESDATALIARRNESGVDTTTIAWVWVAGVLTQAKADAIGERITARASRYSADILSLAGDGRAFRRCRIVVDASKSPPAVIYRQDLTHLGWPLDPEILRQVRLGMPLEQVVPPTLSLRKESR